jgi:hypothetical protein
MSIVVRSCPLGFPRIYPDLGRNPFALRDARFVTSVHLVGFRRCPQTGFTGPGQMPC